MKATTTDQPTITICAADEMGCSVKRGLSGRECCQDCSHTMHGDTR